MKRTAMVAIGGNSLIGDQDHKTVEDQFNISNTTCEHISEMIKDDWNVVITHGNGPQVGFILLRSEIASTQLHSVPLDSIGADTQGSIGYMLQQNLQNKLLNKNINKTCCTVVTQCVVDGTDPAFQRPTKPIGPIYTKEEAFEKKKNENWDITEIPGKGWRRVVASPLPLKIVEIDAIRNLIDGDFVVIALGGGGVPVVEDEKGKLSGIPAVIDKDRASSKLALALGLDLFLISTDIDKVCINFGKPDEYSVDEMSRKEAKEYLEAGEFLPGSMGPKVEAAIDFLEGGGKKVIITSPQNIPKALKGKAGTHITP